MSEKILEPRNAVLKEKGQEHRELRLLRNFAYFLSLTGTGPLPSIM